MTSASSLTQRLVICATLIIGLVLAMMPMSVGVAVWRPDWPLLILIYWIIALPHRISIGIAFLLGVAVDILLGSTFGIHAGAYALVAYTAARHYQRVRNFSLLHQALLVMVLVLVERSLVYIIEYYLHNAPLMYRYFWPALSSALVWPWLFLILRKIRRRFQMV
ncbi:MAG: rod shape-determining protein MreD [Idiomarina sp.]|nr:rod shape-determining protein MreD [Idiomarina sp.]